MKLTILIEANASQNRVFTQFGVEIFAVVSLDASEPFIISVFTISEVSWRMPVRTRLAIDQTLSSQSMWTRPPLISFAYDTMGRRIIIIPVSTGADSVARFFSSVLVFFQTIHFGRLHFEAKQHNQ